MKNLQFLIFLFFASISFGQLGINIVGGGQFSIIQKENGHDYFEFSELKKYANFNGGLTIEYYLSEKISLELGFFRSAKGATFDENILANDDRKELDEGYWLDYFQTPISIKYHRQISKLDLNLGLGLYYGYLRQAYNFYPAYNPWEKKYESTVLRPLDKGFAKTDLGIKSGFGASYQFHSNWSAGIQLFSEWGLCKVLKKNNAWSGNNWSYGAQLFVGYQLQKKKKENSIIPSVL